MKTKNNLEETPLWLSNIRIFKEIRNGFGLEGKMSKKVLILSIAVSYTHLTLPTSDLV